MHYCCDNTPHSRSLLSSPACCPVIMELIIRTDPKNKSCKIHRELGQDCMMIMSLKERIHVAIASTFDNLISKH